MYVTKEKMKLYVTKERERAQIILSTVSLPGDHHLSYGDCYLPRSIVLICLIEMITNSSTTTLFDLKIVFKEYKKKWLRTNLSVGH